MENHTQQQTQQQQILTIFVIFFALTFSIIIYGAVLFVLNKTMLGFDTELELFLNVFASLSVIIGFISFKFNAGLKEFKKVQDYQVKKIICYALNESIALFGFSLSYLSGFITYFLIFGSTAIILNVYMKPDKAFLESLEG